MPTSTISWWVLGQGALGLMLASRMHQHHYPVALKLRDNATLAMPEKQYSYCDHTRHLGQDKTATTTSVSVPIVSTHHPVPDAIFAAIKAYDVAAFIEQYKNQGWGLKAKRPPQLILSYNGMLDDETTLFDGLSIRQLSTTQAAYVDDNTLHHTGQGESFMAGLPKSSSVAHQTDSVLAALQTSIPPVTSVADIEKRRWLKLGVNAVINPLTALHRLPNGPLAETRFMKQKESLCAEFSAIATAAGFAIMPETLMHKIDLVIESTANNFSSMLQDVQLKRRTEIDYVTGFLVRKAAQLEIAAPTHQALLRQFRQDIQH